ncbi:MAG: TolC family protein [Sedimentisphaerales bacterium]|nr:TolC family protein [Sedimentisphaerales bacterium]
MINKSLPESLLFFALFFVIIGLLGGCKSPDELVDEADRDAYAIIEEKWDPNFGEMTNYKINDSIATLDEISELIPPSGVLSLKTAVEIATKYSREYQSQKESLYTSALSLTSTRHQYERQWFGTFDARYRNSAGTESTSVSSSGGVDQAFITAGGILANAGLSIDWTRFLNGDPYTTLGSVLTSSITAPLLGRGGAKSAWENLTQAERNMLYRIRTFNRYRQTFVVNIIRQYYQVLQQEESLEITRASYARRLDSTRQLMMEVEVGQRAQSDADEARQTVLSAENSLVSAEQRYAQTLDSFKITLSLPIDANIVLDPNELTALDNLGVSQPEYTSEDAIQLALDRRLDLANNRDTLVDTERKLALAAEGLGIQANLVASSNVSSPSGETNYERLQFHEGTYSLALETDLPFDQLSQRNSYREALISLQQQKRNFDEDLENIKLEVRQAYRDLIETTQSYEIQKISLELARRRVDQQRMLLELGQGTVRLLLESEDALVQAQNAVTQALINHTLAKLSFFRDIGVLEVKPDGMWEQSKE